MSKPVVVAIVVVALIVVAFVVGIGAGLRNDQGNAAGDRDSGIVGFLKGFAGDAADVDPGDVSSDCLNAAKTVFTFTGSCDVAVKPSDKRVRVLRLHTPVAIGVQAPAPEGDVDDIESDIKPGKDVTIAVGADGAGGDSDRGDIVLSCQAFNTQCQVALLTG